MKTRVLRSLLWWVNRKPGPAGLSNHWRLQGKRSAPACLDISKYSVFPASVSSSPFSPPPLPHYGISLLSNVPLFPFAGDFASHPQPWNFFFFFFFKSCSQSTFWNTSCKGLLWLKLSLSYDQEESGVCFMFSWWKAKGKAGPEGLHVPWKVIRPFQEARNGWGRGGEQTQVWRTSRKHVIYYVITVTGFYRVKLTVGLWFLWWIHWGQCLLWAQEGTNSQIWRSEPKGGVA